MNHHAPKTDKAHVELLRGITLAPVKVTHQRASAIYDLLQHCACSDCIDACRKLNPGLPLWEGSDIQCQFNIPEAAQILNVLIGECSDSSLELAGIICWETGEAFIARDDLSPRLKHHLDQTHAYLRSVIEAKRLLLWFHEELDKLTSRKVRVMSFSLHTDDGIILFDRDTRMRVTVAAVEFVKHMKLPT